MPSLATVLSFGYDSLLLKTRAWVVARAGVAVVSVETLAAFKAALSGEHFNLLLLCHSLSWGDCVAAQSLAASCAPSAKTLVLRSGLSTCALPQGVEHVDTARGPDELIARVQSLLAPIPMPGFFLRRSTCPSTKVK